MKAYQSSRLETQASNSQANILQRHNVAPIGQFFARKCPRTPMKWVSPG